MKNILSSLLMIGLFALGIKTGHASNQENNTIQKQDELSKEDRIWDNVLKLQLVAEPCNFMESIEEEELYENAFANFMEVSHNIINLKDFCKHRNPFLTFGSQVNVIFAISVRMLLSSKKMTEERHQKLVNLLKKCAQEVENKALKHLCTYIPELITLEKETRQGFEYIINFMKKAYKEGDKDVLRYLLRSMAIWRKVEREEAIRDLIINVFKECAESNDKECISIYCNSVVALTGYDGATPKEIYKCISILEDYRKKGYEDALTHLSCIGKNIIKNHASNKELFYQGIDILLDCYLNNDMGIKEYLPSIAYKLLEHGSHYSKLEEVINCFLKKGLKHNDKEFLKLLAYVGAAITEKKDATEEQINAGINLLMTCHQWGADNALHLLFGCSSRFIETNPDRAIDLLKYCFEHGYKNALFSLRDLGERLAKKKNATEKEIDLAIDLLKFCIENGDTDAFCELRDFVLNNTKKENATEKEIDKHIKLLKYCIKNDSHNNTWWAYVYLQEIAQSLLLKNTETEFNKGIKILKYIRKNGKKILREKFEPIAVSLLLQGGVHRIPKSIEILSFCYPNQDETWLLNKIVSGISDAVIKSDENKDVEEIENVFSVLSYCHEVGAEYALSYILLVVHHFYDYTDSLEAEDAQNLISHGLMIYSYFDGDTLLTQVGEEWSGTKNLQKFLENYRPGFVRHFLFGKFLYGEEELSEDLIDSDLFTKFEFSKTPVPLSEEKIKEVKILGGKHLDALNDDFCKLQYMPLALCKSLKNNFSETIFMEENIFSNEFSLQSNIASLKHSYEQLNLIKNSSEKNNIFLYQQQINHQKELLEKYYKIYMEFDENLTALDEKTQEENHDFLCSFSHKLARIIEEGYCFLPISQAFYNLLNPGENVYCYNELTGGVFKTYAINLNDQDYHFITLGADNNQSCTEALAFFDLEPLSCFNKKGQQRFRELQQEIQSNFWAAIQMMSEIKREQFAQCEEIPMVAKQFILGYKLSKDEEKKDF